MKFLVDAQLPAKLAAVLCESGHDAVHTGSLAAGNRTTDSVICDEADSAGRVVVTKDRDFRDSHLLLGTPRRLLIVSTGNISNANLLTLFAQHLEGIVEYLDQHSLVEMTRDRLISHSGDEV